LVCGLQVDWKLGFWLMLKSIEKLCQSQVYMDNPHSLPNSVEYLGVDPDPDPRIPPLANEPDPAIFVIDLQDANKKLI
jgi:hypothetical protein